MERGETSVLDALGDGYACYAPLCGVGGELVDFTLVWASAQAQHFDGSALTEYVGQKASTLIPTLYSTGVFDRWREVWETKVALTMSVPLSIERGKRRVERTLELEVAVAGRAPGRERGMVLVIHYRDATAQARRLEKLTEVSQAAAITLHRSQALERRSRERAQELAVLASELARSATSREVARAATEFGALQLGASSVKLVVPSPDETTMQFLGAYTLEADAEPVGLELALDTEVPLAEVLRTGMEHWSEGRSRGGTGFGSSPTQSLAVLPLYDQGQVIGALGIGYRETTWFDEGDREFLRAVGAQVGQALARARLFDQQTLAAKLLSALQQVTPQLSQAGRVEEVAWVGAVEVGRALGAASGALALLDEGELCTISAFGCYDEAIEDGQGAMLPDAMWEAVERREAVWSPNRKHWIAQWGEEAVRGAMLNAGAEALVVFPLFGEEGVIGAVSWAWLDESIYRVREQLHLPAVVDQCAQAVARVRSEARERDALDRLELLVRAGSAFAGRLDDQELLDLLGSFIVPELASSYGVYLKDESGGLKLAATRAREPAMNAAMEAFLSRFTPRLDDETGVGKAIRTNRMQPLQGPSSSLLRQLGGTPELGLLEALDLGSGVTLPFGGPDGADGAVCVARGRDEPELAAEELSLLIELCNRAASSVRLARVYREQSELALAVQRSLLPVADPVALSQVGTEVALRYVPAARGIEVGGDWVEAMALAASPQGYTDPVYTSAMFIVGDVTGHGLEAATQMGSLRAASRAYALDSNDPAQLLGRLNALVLSQPELQLATCLAAHWDPRARLLTYASAGHPPLVLVAPDGTARVLDVNPAPPLGIGEGTPELRAVSLPEGAALIGYTDGLVESRTQSVGEGIERLVEACQGGTRTPEAWCRYLLTELGRDGANGDDVALLVAAL